jgi:hypothetical protein
MNADLPFCLVINLAWADFRALNEGQRSGFLNPI